MKHTFFSNYSNEEALQDMRGSKERLQELTGHSVELFAFPYGSFAACGWSTHKLVRQVYRYGFSTINAPITKRVLLPKGFLPRINVDNNTIKHIKL
jgi:peptidoglycan/xylan/chitin deacetylase (PgdA/CDA1 family)